MSKPEQPHRVVIECVEPQVDGARFPVKRTPGEPVRCTADIFADGHDMVHAVVRWRDVGPAGEARSEWREVRMEPHVNDRWTAAFTAGAVGWAEYTIEAWIDRFATWRRDLGRKFEAGQDVSSDLLEGAAMVRDVAERVGAGAADTRRVSASDPAGVSADAGGADPWPGAEQALNDAGIRVRLRARADALAGREDQSLRVTFALDPSLAAAMARHGERFASVTLPRPVPILIEPERARFGSWYEMFPRSAGPDATRSATFDEAAQRLPEIAEMGFDVLYLPPVHPIGRTFRKGPNNTLTAGPGDPGSPWAIGGREGGHMAIEPGLGTLADFDRFVERAGALGLEIALDIAFQCSPDHPYVREHPEWFRHRPDGSIKYAENPPKKYQDIYPFDFECRDWPALWEELKRIVLFWVTHGVRIFRVDNPHTKPFAFWEWLIREVRREHPGIIFLSEAFTRPKIMKYLAKLGFSQSYSYFTWRNTRPEITEYFTELTQTPVREYMRPNLFANTPDILHEYLQLGGRPAFETRLVLAATLGASYGIYSGFELCENRALKPGSEEYLDSEKYQIRHRDWSQPGHIKPLITRVNAIRRAHAALQSDRGLRFHATDTPQLICYSKSTPDLVDILLIVVNLDPFGMQHGFVQVPVPDWSLDPAGYAVDDLLSGERYHWRGEWNYVRLDPGHRPAHILHVKSPAAMRARDEEPRPTVSTDTLDALTT